jgi:hypothetical protein
VPDLDTVRSAMATASTVGAETGVPGDGGASKAAAGEQLAFLSTGGALLAGEPQAPSVSDASVVRAPARLPAVTCLHLLPGWLHPCLFIQETAGQECAGLLARPARCLLYARGKAPRQLSVKQSQVQRVVNQKVHCT